MQTRIQLPQSGQPSRYRTTTLTPALTAKLKLTVIGEIAPQHDVAEDDEQEEAASEVPPLSGRANDNQSVDDAEAPPAPQLDEANDKSRAPGCTVTAIAAGNSLGRVTGAGSHLAGRQ